MRLRLGSGWWFRGTRWAKGYGVRPQVATDRREGASSSIEPVIRQIVAERLGIESDDVVPGVSLRDDLAADSLDLAELLVALESEFAIVASDTTSDDVRTYDDLVRVIRRLIGEQRPPAPTAAGECSAEWDRPTQVDAA
jgi:acyl carrier protein